MLILLILVIQLKKTDQNTKTNEKKPLIMIILGIGPTQGLDDSFSANNMKKKRIKWVCVRSSVNYKTFDISNIVNIH